MKSISAVVKSCCVCDSFRESLDRTMARAGFHKRCGFIFIAAISLLITVVSAGDEVELKTRLRRPVSLAVAGERLYVANQRGSLSVIDPKSAAVTAEFDIAKRLAWISAIPDTQTILAVDEESHQLITLVTNGDDVTVSERVEVSPYPVHVVYSAKASRCFITSLWSRRLTIIEWQQGTPTVVQQIDLPLAPRCQVLTPDESTLIIGDAFGGNLMIVNAASGEIEQTRNFPAHNIRGLAISGDGKTLVVAHQMLNEFATSVQNDIHWGLLMSNDLRWLSLDSVLDPQQKMLKDSHMHPLGQPNQGDGDPSGVAVAADGTVIVSMAAVSKIAFGDEDDFSLLRRNVGRRPTAVVTSADSRFAYVANTFSDSVSVLDFSADEIIHEIKLGPMPELTETEQGETLFYDGRLALDGWMSCHSCHTDGHTNAQLNDNFSDASFGAPKSVLSLLGAHDTAPYAWNGRAKDLSAQIKKSITITMQKRSPPSDTQIASLAAFVKTLDPPPSIDKARREANDQAISRGAELFRTQKCVECHAPPTYTSQDTFDVGLVDKEGNTHFNPPSLRGVGQRRSFFHDNRAGSLVDVLIEHEHPQKHDLSEQETSDLIAFLRSL